jgi:WhiB family redox-sensing transcriptional regulator
VNARERWQWIDHAACKDLGTDKMFPHEGDKVGVEAARAVCAGCLVRNTCLHTVFHDIAGPKQDGVWGGATYEDRVEVIKIVSNRKRNAAKRAAKHDRKG